MKHLRCSLYLFTPLTFLLFACNSNNNTPAAQATIDSLTKQVQTLKATQQQLETNKKMVADFYQQLFGDKDVSVIDKYISDPYIQHNPILPDGKEPLKEACTKWFKGLPKEKIDIQHLSAEDNLVYIHTKEVHPGIKTVSVMDIFKIENGKIVEHWDLGQDVPEKSANPHPMF